MELSMNVQVLIDDAKRHKRITNKYLRDRWGVDEEEADFIYKLLKQEGVIQGMGYVVKE